jgi:hypothetical protein
MFLTKDDLKLSYGVDLRIGAAYVDRAVPTNNLYWKNRSIYLPGAPGYIFIPIYTDLLYRSGVPLDELLSEHFIMGCEGILHSAALQEYGEVTWQQHIEQVIEVIKGNVVRPSLLDALISYALNEKPLKKDNSIFGTEFPSLNRADSYLFVLTTIQSPNFDQEKAIKAWYALMTYFLLLDDLADIKDDLKTGQENVLVEAGLNVRGEKIISEMMDASIQVMNAINPIMANRIDHKKSLIDLPGLIQSIKLEK